MSLLTVVPAILSFLGGPAGGLAGAGLQWLAGKLGASDTTVDAIKRALDGFKPEDQLAMRRLDLEFQEFCMANAIQIDLAQIEVNKEEARTGSLFIGGWRPATGWICAVGLGYVAIVEPLARFVCTLAGYNGLFPTIDTSLTMQVLIGMLGLGGLRTYEKKQGVASP